MQEKKAKLLENVTMQKHTDASLCHIIETSSTIKTIYRTVEKGEEVTAIVYPTQNYFLGTPYFDVIDTHGFNCAVPVESIEFVDT